MRAVTVEVQPGAVVYVDGQAHHAGARVQLPADRAGELVDAGVAVRVTGKR